MSGARSSTAIILSMECNRYPLDRLPGAHGVDEKFQWGKIPILDEFDGGMVLKISVGGIEKIRALILSPA